jgi:hypothetical protein
VEGEGIKIQGANWIDSNEGQHSTLLSYNISCWVPVGEQNAAVCSTKVPGGQ